MAVVDYFWTDHGSGNNLASDQLNWNDGASGYPDGANDHMEFDSRRTDDCVIDVPLTLGSIYLAAGYVGKVTQSDKIILTTAGGGAASMSIEGGEYDQNGQVIEIVGAGMWWRDPTTGGIYTHGGGLVEFKSTGGTIAGESRFGDLKMDVSNSTLIFEASMEQIIDGELFLKGDAVGNLALTSSTPGTRYKLTLYGTKNVDYLTVTDCDFSGSAAQNIMMNPSNSTDGGNNIDVFGLVIQTAAEYDHNVVKAIIETIDDTLYLKSIKGSDGRVHIISKLV